MKGPRRLITTRRRPAHGAPHGEKGERPGAAKVARPRHRIQTIDAANIASSTKRLASGEFHNQPLATAAIARIITGTSTLTLCEHRIVYAPVAGHEPGLDGIEMSGAAGLFQLGDAPVFIQLRLRRLNVTLVIRATGHEHRLFSVPTPVKGKPGVRLRMHRGLKLRFLPALAAVGGDFDLTDRASTGPSQASNLDVSPAG